MFLSASVSYLRVYIDFKHGFVCVIAKNTSVLSGRVGDEEMRQEATGIPDEKEKWWTHRDHNLFVNSGQP